MTTQDRNGTSGKDDKPEGSEPTRKSKHQDEKIRDDAQRESGGEAPIDPADEHFIGERKTT